MAKVIIKYRGYTAAQLKSRATIPNQADMIIVGNTVECVNITTAKIRNAIGVASNAIGNLSSHANVNVWSGFGPTVRSVATQVLINNVGTSPHAMGEFAGYNHGARIPGWITNAPSGDIWINANSDAIFTVDVYVGEVQYQLISPAIVGITLAIYNSAGNLVGWGSRNFETDLVQDDVTSLQATVYSIGVETTYTGRIWLVGDTSAFDDSQISCRLPNTSDFTQTVKLKSFSEWHYDGDAQVIPSPWVVNGSVGMNFTTGYFTLNNIASPTGYANVKIYARLFDWTYTQIGIDVILYNNVYYPPDDIYASEYMGMVNIPDHGYHVFVYFEYTI